MSPSLTGEGKPHIFLLDDPKREKEHIIQYERHQEAQKEYAEIINVMYEVVKTQKLSDTHLDVLKHGMESRFKGVWGEAGRRLVQLSHYFRQAEAALFELLIHKHATVRLRLVQSLWNNRPHDSITKTLLKQGLHDKSKHVRYFSLDRIRLFNYTDLLADVEALTETETDHEVLACLDMTIHLLKNGFYLTQDEEDHDYTLIVATRRGLSIARIPPEKRHESYIKQKIQELRQSKDLY